MSHTSKIIYKGDLRTQATHLRSGISIITDAPVDNEGKGGAFSPTDLTATALASCMLTIMGIKARNMGLNLEGAEAKVLKIMQSNPRRIAAIEIDIFVSKPNLSDKEKNLLQRAAKTCPVALSLHPDLRQEVRFHFAGS